MRGEGLLAVCHLEVLFVMLINPGSLSRSGTIYQFGLLAALISTPIFFLFGIEIAAALSLVVGTACLALRYPKALLFFMIVTSCFSLSVIHSQKDIFVFLGGADPNGIRLFLVVAVAFPVLLLNYIRDGLRLPRSLIFYVVLVVIVWVSLFWAPSFITGLRFAFKLVYPLHAFMLFRWLERKGEVDLDWFLKIALWTYIISSTIAYATYLVGVSFIVRQPGADGWRPLVGPLSESIRFVSPIGPNSNPHALTLAVAALISAHTFFERERYRWLAVVSLLITFSVMFSTFTRIAFFSFFVALTIMLLLRGRFLSAGASIVLFALLFFLTPMFSRTFFVVEQPIEMAAAPEISETPLGARDDEEPIATKVSYHLQWQGRDKLWDVAWQKFKSSPIVGGGVGSTTVALREAFPGNLKAEVVHNEFLRIAAEVGVIGFFMLLSFLVVQLWNTLIQWLTGNREAILGGCVLIVYVASMLTDNTLDYYSGIGFLVFLCIALVYFDADTRCP